MRKLFIVAISLILVLSTVSTVFAVSQAAVLFLMISPGARAAGMGEAFVAMADDATAAYWNPAGLAFQDGREVTIMHANWLPQLVSDMYYDFLAYRQHFESLGGTLGVNVTYLNMGEQVHTDPKGVDLGTFQSWDLAVTLSYATKISSNFGFGVGARYIHSHLAPIGAGTEKGKGIADGFALDIGVLYQNLLIHGLSFGANLSNMGPKITYIDAAQADPIPTNLKVGLAYKLLDMEYNELTLTMDTNKLLVVRHGDEAEDFYRALFSAWTDEKADKLISSVGLEYGYSDMIFLRGGYYYDEDGKVKYPSFGAGLKYSRFRFDFAYVAAEQGHPLSDTMRFSLSIGI